MHKTMKRSTHSPTANKRRSASNKNQNLGRGIELHRTYHKKLCDDITTQQQNNPIARTRSTVFTMQSSDCSDDVLVKDLSINSQKRVGGREQHHNARGGKRNTGGVPTTKKSKAAHTSVQKQSPQNNMGADGDEGNEDEDYIEPLKNSARNKDNNDDPISKSNTRKVARKVVSSSRQHNDVEEEEEEEEDDDDVEEELKRRNRAQMPWSHDCMKQFKNSEGMITIYQEITVKIGPR
jgi:hypothetical protein